MSDTNKGNWTTATPEQKEAVNRAWRGESVAHCAVAAGSAFWKLLWARTRLVMAVFGFVLGSVLLIVWSLQNWMLVVAAICLWGATDDWKKLKWRKPNIEIRHEPTNGEHNAS